MSVRERLTVKIDLKDAIFGGVAIYVSVFLITALFTSFSDIILRYTNIISNSGELLTRTGLNSENLVTIFGSVLLIIFLATFFIAVLFDENLFSKHETGLADLLGLGLVWGMSFVALDALIETFLIYISMYQNWDSFYSLSLRELFFGFPYWIAVLYIIFLPTAIYYLRKNHREHMEKTK